MPNYATDGKIGIDLDTVASADASSYKGLPATLGETVNGTMASEWIFVRASSALTAGALVGITTSNEVSAITDAAVVSVDRRLGFAQTAFQTSQYGFVATRGNNILVRIAGNMLGGGGVAVYTTDTAGCLGSASASASHFQVWGVYLKSSVSASGSTATAVTAAVSWPHLRRPRVGGG